MRARKYEPERTNSAISLREIRNNVWLSYKNKVGTCGFPNIPIIGHQLAAFFNCASSPFCVRISFVRDQ